VIIFLTVSQQHGVAPETLQPGAIEANSSRTTGTSINGPPGQTEQQHRQQLVHRDAAIVATGKMTQDAHLKIVHTTGGRRIGSSMRSDVRQSISV